MICQAFSPGCKKVSWCAPLPAVWPAMAYFSIEAKRRQLYPPWRLTAPFLYWMYQTTERQAKSSWICAFWIIFWPLPKRGISPMLPTSCTWPSLRSAGSSKIWRRSWESRFLSAAAGRFLLPTPECFFSSGPPSWLRCWTKRGGIWPSRKTWSAPPFPSAAWNRLPPRF